MTDRGHPTDLIRAAGAVVWRATERRPEVALVHRPRLRRLVLSQGQGEAAAST